MLLTLIANKNISLFKIFNYFIYNFSKNSKAFLLKQFKKILSKTIKTLVFAFKLDANIIQNEDKKEIVLSFSNKADVKAFKEAIKKKQKKK